MDKSREDGRTRMCGSARTFLISLFIFFTFVPLSESRAQEPVEQESGIPKINLTDVGLPRVFWRSVEYGIGAGALVGFVSASNFKRNFTTNFDDQSIFRGASYGLYGGILLGVYLAFLVPEPKIGNSDQPDQNPEPVPPSAQMRKRLRVDPFLSSTGAAGVQLRWAM